MIDPNPSPKLPDDERWIRWVDVTPTSWQLHASPLSVASLFSRQVQASGRAWILTSATLAVGRDFSLYQHELGLADATTGCWDSPFDYAAQALLYVPPDMPAPTTATSRSRSPTSAPRTSETCSTSPRPPRDAASPSS